MYTGKFDFHNNCSLIHHIPQDMGDDCYPVIVFPPKQHSVVPGKTYSYVPQLTRRATYTFDGQKYRVAHATSMMLVEGDNGADYVDTLVHKSTGDSSTTMGDVFGTGLAALKARLEATN